MNKRKQQQGYNVTFYSDSLISRCILIIYDIS